VPHHDTSYIVRRAGTVDLPAINEIITSAYAMYVPRIGRQPGPMLADYAALINEQKVFVLEIDRAVQGVLVLIPEKEVMLLENVAIRPKMQGLGLGQILYQFAERQTIEAGFRSIKLYTHELMTENIALYLRAGYVETHRVEVDGFRRVYMVKDVANT
jgi:N-acetylglutamate synthase-like GNAT family acetyltransferase